MTNLEETVGWSTAFGVIAVAVIVSNFITIIIFTRRQFKRKLAYYLLVNLAVTDLTVGAIILPLYIAVTIYVTNSALNLAYRAFDIVTGTTSVCSIALISLERLCAVGWPWKHRVFQQKHYVLCISLSWLYGVVLMVFLCFVFVHGTMDIEGDYLFICATGTPLLITVVAYVVLYVMEKKSKEKLRQKSNTLREIKLLKTLLLVTVIFILTWTPFIVANFLYCYSCIHGTCLSINFNVIKLVKLLQYGNSFANSVVYVLRIRRFRVAIKDMFNQRKEGISRNLK